MNTITYKNTLPNNNNINFGMRISMPVNMSKNIIEDIVKGNISEHFVPTPANIINLMVEELGGIKPWEKILEPSAGYGHIAETLVKKSGLTPNNIDVIEPVESLRRILHSKGFNLVGYNILNYKPKVQYDKIIMNPPFYGGNDILHLLHCYSILKPNGKLVAILPENDFIPPRQPGYEKWMKDWLGNGQIKEINEYLDRLLKTNESKVIKLGKAFIKSDVPDDVETRLVVVKKNRIRL